jgi:TolA-binding protein
METLDDLLIKRRRGTLAAAEERRLDRALRASREYELALLAHEVFDRDGEPLAGDAARLRELVDVVSRQLPPAPPPPRAWRAPVPVAAALLAAGAAAAALGISRTAPREPVPVAPVSAPAALTDVASPPPVPAPPPPEPAVDVQPPAWPALEPHGLDAPESRHRAPALRRAPAPRRSLARRSAAAAASLAPAAPARVAAVSLAPAAPARVAAVSLAPAAPARVAAVSLAPAAPARVAAADAPPPARDESPSDESAQSLFRRANRLRRSDWSAAAASYLEVIRRHPTSNEAGVSEVALGKWSLAEGRSGDALEWFRAYQRRGPGALCAEALFGEARALESIGSHAAARVPWQQLLERYPDSPYANVARQRLGP